MSTNNTRNLPEGLWPGWNTVRVLGRGSYGTVYEIERVVLGQAEKAALKCVSLPQNPGDFDDLTSNGFDEAGIRSHYDTLLEGIVREYRLMAEMRGHANIVSCDDFSYERQDNGLGWDVKIKMELLQPMTKLPVSPAPEGQAIRVGLDLSRALIECKNRSIVHRDIKPQNIFISPYGDYKLGDFGIARTMDKTSGATKTGTYNYMAPEVYHEQPYGHQADVYSLGLVLYWLLNERRGPFLPLPPVTPTAADMERARFRRYHGEAIPAPAHGSEALKAIVLKACAFDPKDRYAHAGELYNELEALRIAAAAAARAQEKEPSAPPQGGSAQDDKVVPVGAIHESPAANRTDSPCTVGADASPPGTTRRQEPPWSLGGPTSTQKDPSTPLRSAQDDKETAVKPKKGKGALLGAAAAAALLIAALILVPRLRGGAATETGSAGEPAAEAAAQEDAPVTAEQGENGAFSYVLMGDALTITGSGELQSLSDLIPNWDSVKHEIRTLSLGEGITGIGSSAFADCPSLTRARLPEGLTEIGSYAFQYCTALEAVRFPASLETIGPYAFDDCHALSSIRFGGGLTEIGGSAFADCPFLTRVRLPEGLVTLGDQAFANCPALEQMELPRSVQRVGRNVLRGTFLKDLYYPGTQEEFEAIEYFSSDGGSAALDPFYGAEIHYESSMPGDEGSETFTVGELDYTVTGTTLTISGEGQVPRIDGSIVPDWGELRESLTELRVAHGVTGLDSYAFSDWSALRVAYLPKSLTGIGSSAFAGCTGLRDCFYAGRAEDWSAVSIWAGNEALQQAALHANVIVPTAGGLTFSDGTLTYSFSGATLTITGKGTIPLSTTEWSAWDMLRKGTVLLVIDEGITGIESNVFANFISLRAVQLPESLLSLQGNTFLSCSELDRVRIPKGVREFSPEAFNQCYGILEYQVDEESAGFCAVDGAVYNKAGTTLLLFPSGVTGDYAIPEGVTRIGKEAFRMSRLSSVTLPESCRVIGDCAFTFSQLRSIALPANLTAIGTGAFNKCDGLKDLYFGGSEAQWASVSIGNANVQLLDGVTIHFESSMPGDEDAEALVCEADGLTYTISGTRLTVTGTGEIKNLIYAIPDWDTYKTTLTELEIGEGVTAIGERAFISCRELTSISLPDSLTAIRSFAFSNCVALTNIRIPEGVKSIGNDAFSNCYKLTSISLPESLASVGTQAFNQCDDLKDVYYSGSEEQWRKITIDAYNDPLLNATVHYNAS